MTTLNASGGLPMVPGNTHVSSDALTDAALLARMASGHEASLALLAERYENYLYGLALGVLRRRSDLAQEAVQETWVRVIRGAKAFRGESSFKTWVYRILVNRCIEVAEREHRHARMRVGANEKSQAASDAAAESSERSAALTAALDRLSVSQRVVVLLCYHRGLTHTHAADVLGIPPGTLKSRLNAALGALREMLGAPNTRDEVKP